MVVEIGGDDITDFTNAKTNMAILSVCLKNKIENTFVHGTWEVQVSHWRKNKDQLKKGTTHSVFLYFT
jgi:hypothetical protein